MYTYAPAVQRPCPFCFWHMLLSDGACICTRKSCNRILSVGEYEKRTGSRVRPILTIAAYATQETVVSSGIDRDQFQQRLNEHAAAAQTL